MNSKNILQLLPSIDSLLNDAKARLLADKFSRKVVKSTCHTILQELREKLIHDDNAVKQTRREFSEFILARAESLLTGEFSSSLVPVINATGVILHTGLGRAPLSSAARKNVARVMRDYCSLEIDLTDGKRGERTEHVRSLLCRLTGAESALVVNNNAAAVFITLNSLSFGREAVISRGQLVEIGGSFRIPDVMEKSGAIMREVGTTNKTKAGDYVKAINSQTGALVAAHTSNYRIMGFTEEVGLEELVRIAAPHNIPVIHDLGGGVLVDLQQFGLPYEPLVQDSITAGADVVTFSGDKVLGGPQCGIIVGKKSLLDRIHANPIMRIVRCDKLTYAALEATLKSYFQPHKIIKTNKTLKLLTASPASVRNKAEKLVEALPAAVRDRYKIMIEESQAQTGSGALPLEQIASYAVTLQEAGAGIDDMAAQLRNNNPPVLGYIKNGRLYLDLRTVGKQQINQVAMAIERLK
ncbi:MAG TPA: L-seryl-tRNA(Sec) selenium transferase [bacterium]|nr:L-seryl-tRNA(Sec) selenium transferase [bacterium]HPN42087.1 L-seryl-tRNA(Sec) selenium transferase [bacterium]